ncbi:MAG TPA: hypothetical protein DET40_03355 [Lentisphaeria bacterium]|nr:MAG: hypothetical protein A2X45_22140 [Lentisphaerae bacterium GWF2_50_93]HCE42565.1 hypothetical protein [Lentisphaeria bacterium]
MKIGISRFSRPEEMRQVLEAAAKFGFAGVQLKENQYRAQGLDVEKFMGSAGNFAKLAAGGLIAYPPGDLNRWIEHVGPVINFAAGIGAGHVCICSGGVRKDDAVDDKHRLAGKILMELGRTAKKLGIEISLHNHEGSIWETEQDIAKTAECLDPEFAGLTVDTGHCAKCGIKDIPAMIRRFKKYLVNVHLKDVDAGGNFCALGTGTQDLGPVIKVLDEIGYAKWLIVDEESKNVPVEQAFDIAKKYLQKEGALR